jgi:hypothetical protein
MDTSNLVNHPPCASCYERLFPAAQDHQLFDLDTFLTEEEEQEGEHDDVSLDSLMIWGDHNEELLEDVMQDVREVQSRWPLITLPVERTRVVEGYDGSTRTFRYYKPFRKHIDETEMDEFKTFLTNIF